MPVTKAERQILDRIEGRYSDLSLPERGAEMAHRATLPQLVEDYAVETIVEDELTPKDRLPDAELERDLVEFTRVARAQRRYFQEQEIGRMHEAWKAGGGRVLTVADQPLETYLSAMLKGENIVAGGVMVHSRWYGDVNPILLNGGITQFTGGVGQIRLMSALAVATGRYNLNLKILGTALKNAGGDAGTLGWKQLPIDWRRGQVILSSPQAYGRGIPGYKKFAAEYADGDMLKAYMLASALLSNRDFEALDWGKGVKLKVRDYDRYVALLKDVQFQGRPGYKKFAAEHAGGNMLKAYQLASALLSKPDFEALGWGKAVLLKVRDSDRYVALLKDPQFRGRPGYKKFAAEYADGDMLKAYMLASALLSSQDFEALDWGKEVPLKVRDYDRYVALLKDPQFRGRSGYKKFAAEHADGDMYKACILASALLSKPDFEALDWGKAVKLKVRDYEAIRDYLFDGLASGGLRDRDGWAKYLKEHGHGNPQSAWSNASAILEDRFAELGWPSSYEIVQEGKLKRGKNSERGFVVFPGSNAAARLAEAIRGQLEKLPILRGHFAANGEVYVREAMRAVERGIGSGQLSAEHFDSEGRLSPEGLDAVSRRLSLDSVRPGPALPVRPEDARQREEGREIEKRRPFHR